ncbi:OmpA family protein [Xanthomonas phaseoli]|uniref:OmpA family protein n=2 Tax=Xanthomonas TaxID=338 RepID=UPI000C62ED0A|nr:OmpA family protein [Xanthomonas phaseoli]ATS26031.2 OmpA family protein [Xanthomonas phaseoli pv. phaseoli]MBO9744681.1 OmpA family protein [Xanthomonas phaseoli pv. phaseoli]MDM4805317.1 OmpA family protein [Xanthomonas phaseoli pv. phaseoli]UNW12945.1 OmpA family protein [Xanthomonas phaseoli pv. phaseoli]UZB28611.1 OmpA family protein [Xanthomonas phaseoli pv. phaseoli]
MNLYQYQPLPRRDVGRGPEESPFWVSLSDMMTGMTSLFLVLACSMLLIWIIQSEPSGGTSPRDEKVVGADAAATMQRDERSVDAAANTSHNVARLAAYESDISAALKKILALSQQHGFSVDVATNTIDLGQSALFPLGSDRLSAKQEALLRSYVTDLIALIQNDPAMVPLKNITVVGYTDPAGSYLFNLDLSARRSERLMCVLLASPEKQGGATGDATMTEGSLQTIRQLFKVGGYSAGAQKESAAASRRLALKMDFYKLDEPRRQAIALAMPVGSCALGSS